MGVAPRKKLTEEEYLALERAAEFKSEFLAGEVFAMAGATFEHALIVGNAVGELRQQLKGRPCVVVPTDLRVRVEETGLYTYPDVVVVCGTPRFADEQEDTLLNPTLIIEVLSPSTEAYDRGAKFAHYRRISSLREYVLVTPTYPRVERFERQERGPDWTLSEVSGLTESVTLATIGCTLRLAELYDRVEVSAEPHPPLRP